MHWPPRIATPQLLILPVSRDAHGVYSIYCRTDGQPGLVVATQAQSFLRDQVLAALGAHLGKDCVYVPQPAFFVQAQLCGEETSAVLVSVNGSVSSAYTAHFRNFAQVLRALPKDRNRLIFLKAWQFLAGTGDVKARVIATPHSME